MKYKKYTHKIKINKNFLKTPILNNYMQFCVTNNSN